MRIVSLLPSLTELVDALGKSDDLVGVTHECDYPPGVDRLPHLTRSRIPGSAGSAEIDALVVEQRGSLYDLDAELLGRVRPDLILTQEQCDVCAVNEATVRRVASGLPGAPFVESVNPTDLAGLFAMFRRVGELLGVPAEAERVVGIFEATRLAIGRRLDEAGRAPRRAVLLEWFDPPYASGHWNPEIVGSAGGTEALARAGERSRRISWEALAEADPEVILLAPCGFTLGRTAEELPGLIARPEWRCLRAVRDGGVVAVDGSAYFSRPGPRLETSLRIAAAALHPDLFDDLAPEGGWRRLPPSR